MELINQIKDAEKQAKEIVAKGRVDSAKLSEEASKRGLEQLEAAEQKRKNAITDALTEAEQIGVEQVQQLKSQGSTQIEQLQSAAQIAGKHAN